MNQLFTKLGVAGVTSVAVVESVNLDPLWNALITLAISIITVLTVDGMEWLKTKIKKDIKKTEEESKKDKEE